ncbi:MAG: DUF1540 domain-containing protein [Christensenellales bacterium]
MNAPEMKVKCTVENCHFYKGNMCHADSIEVMAMGDGRAQTSEGTCCKTFRSNW